MAGRTASTVRKSREMNAATQFTFSQTLPPQLFILWNSSPQVRRTHIQSEFSLLCETSLERSSQTLSGLCLPARWTIKTNCLTEVCERFLNLGSLIPRALLLALSPGSYLPTFPTVLELKVGCTIKPQAFC